MSAANLPYTQNQKWAKDSGGFGFRMLAKMGWTEGKGLGKKEDGAVTHVRVKKRAEQLALGAEGVVDMTGNASLVGAVQDFNTLLSQLSAVGTGACGAAGSARDHNYECPTPACAGAGSASASSGGARVMKRIAYHKVLRSKDAASYSARDLASIVVGAAYPDTAPPPAAAAPAAAAPIADAAAGLKRRRRSMSEASVASAPSVRSTRSTTRRAAAAAVAAPAAADAGDEKAAKAARKLERQARREAKAERAAKREARRAAAAAAEASD